MNEEISGYLRQIRELEKQLQELKDNCKHNFEPRYTITKEQEEMGWAASTQCTECGKYGGWYCPTSPTKVCQYDDINDPINDFCLHCGGPDERK